MFGSSLIHPPLQLQQPAAGWGDSLGSVSCLLHSPDAPRARVCSLTRASTALEAAGRTGALALGREDAPAPARTHARALLFHSRLTHAPTHAPPRRHTPTRRHACARTHTTGTTSCSQPVRLPWLHSPSSLACFIWISSECPCLCVSCAVGVKTWP